MLIDELDRNGNIIGSKKITVEVFPVLHELLTVEDINTGEVVYYDPNAVEYFTEKPVVSETPVEPEPIEPDEPIFPTVTVSHSTLLLYAVPIVLILIGVFVFVIIKNRPE